jgi:Predicted acetyltransferase
MTLIPKIRLDEADLRALDSLRAACEAQDCVSSLELEKSLNAHKDMPSFFLAYADDALPDEAPRLAGILSIFAPMSQEAELGALVMPSERRRGVFASLLAEAERVLAAYEYSSELFVVDARSAAGREAALRLGASLEHSELAMRYERGLVASAIATANHGLEIKRLGLDSLGELVRLRAEAFGGSESDAESFERSTLAAPDREQLGAYRGGSLVAALSIGYSGDAASINAFVVAEPERGRGIGQAFLGVVAESLVLRGLRPVLDVDSRNEAALHVYRKLGFAVESRVDYYGRPMPAPAK